MEQSGQNALDQSSLSAFDLFVIFFDSIRLLTQQNAMPPALATGDNDHRSDEVAPSCFSCLLGMLNPFRKKRNYTRARPSPSTFRQDRERVLHRTSPFTVTANVETSSSLHSAAMSYRPLHAPYDINHSHSPLWQVSLCFERRLHSHSSVGIADWTTSWN